MERRWTLLLAAVAVGGALALAGALIVPWPNTNHKSAEEVVRDAGISPGVTPGVHP